METKLSWNGTTVEGCTIEQNDDTVVLSADPGGGYIVFTGAAGSVGGVDWTPAKFLVLDATAHEEWTVGVTFRLWAADGASGGDPSQQPDMRITMGLMPDLPTRLSLPLAALDSQTMFMPRTPGKLKTVVVGERLDPARIVRLELGVMPAHAPVKISIGNLRMTDIEPEYPVPAVKLVDEIGQYTRKEWPGKTGSVDELVSSLTNAHEAADADAPVYPGRNHYGGWSGRSFDATGFFRTHHDGHRWWLVDPAGAPFFSTGPDCVRPEIECPVEGIEQLFSWLPPKGGDYADAWSHRAHHGGVAFFDFGIANLIRAFGSGWRPAWERLVAHRLRTWGFNTIANWSDRGITRSAHLPYVWPLVGFPSTTKTIFRDFPDVFSDEYQQNADRFASQLGEFRGDPLMIGYFLRNEPTWAFVHGLIIAEEVLATTATTAPGSRQALVAHLSDVYGGDVGKLNAAWKSEFGSFAELETRIIPHARRLSAAAHNDLLAFSRRMIRRYVEIPSKACRRIDPVHLNLGMRYAYIMSDLLLEGSECFDVFSINCYQMDPTEHINSVGKSVKLPIMIGEYHFGALDRGLVANALRGVATQTDRGVAYRYYLERAAANPHCVGAHYFTVADEATLGRYDGENWNIGLEDVCRRPYDEFLEGVVAAHTGLYDVATGNVAPTEAQAAEVPRNAF